MAFAHLLIELRTARGMSQEALAEKAAVSVRAISDLERGVTRRPHRQTLTAIVDALGLTGWERTAFEEAAEQAKPSMPRPRATVPVRLPAPTTSIIGREPDVTALGRFLRGQTIRLVTVTGPGGVGKTRLAAEVAWRIGAGFERVDGVDLSPLGTPDDVPGALANALGCATVAADPVQAVASVIGDRPWLLVLDSFEHLAEAALTVADLLGRCPRLRLLVTSRSPLRLRGEHLWPLRPLPVPAESERDLAALGSVPAMALLVERARAVRPGFALAGANAQVLARLCRRLDGLPLALELAAAQLRTLDPADLMAQLDGQLSALRAEAVDVPDRQHTLRSTVAWSVERLGAEPQRMLTVLAAFAGGAAPALARRVLDRAGLDPAALDRSVPVLAATSLVAVEDRAGSSRVTMLDTIREVAAGTLADSGTAPAIQRAHAATFLDLLRDTPADRLDRIDTELDNVRVGLSYATGHAATLLDAAVVEAFSRYCLMRSRFREVYRVLSAVADTATDPSTRAQALRGAGMGANETGDHDTAITLAQRAATLFEETGDVPGRCGALTLQGNAHKAVGRNAAAQAVYLACLELARGAGYLRGVTVTLNNLGTLAHDRAEHELARRYYRESLEVKRRLGDEHGIAVTLMNLGAVANDLGQYAQARADLRPALDTLRALGEQHTLAFGLVLLAEAECGLGAYAAARAAADEGLTISREVSHQPTVALALTRLGDIAVATGDHRGAQTLYREALSHGGGPPEVARAMEHLAAVRADSFPDEARELLRTAEQLRRAHDAPPPPADRGLLDRIRRLTAGN